jgi:ribosomal-protein-alanine N-acetyltransferase
VGYAGLMCIEPIADVQTIAVVPEQEGRGIGSALLTRLIDEARRRRAADVLLEVREDNPRAQQLYVRFGFEQIHVRRKYYRDGVDALIMRLQLVPDGSVPGSAPADPTRAADPTPEAGSPTKADQA